MRALLAALALLAAQAAGAVDFRSVAEDAVVLYDAPSRAATPMWVVSRDYPLEVIVNLEAWAKVRDHTGTLSWVEKRLLSEKRTVLITAPTADVYRRPEADAPLAFVVAQNVALELLGSAPGGWLRVRHADGANGYLRATQVWGG
ncbi:MAG: SH3 domain-containing protein [Burkholderiales bacterium]|nr:SH3 domain-containing protein [Burkholderiales bacterium]